jgi:hypothetical protein
MSRLRVKGVGALLCVATALHAAPDPTIPCGIGPVGVQWRVLESTTVSVQDGQETHEKRRVLERWEVSVSSNGAWHVDHGLTDLAGAGLSTSVRFGPGEPQGAREWASTPPCSSLSVGATWAEGVPGGRSLRWTVARHVDSTGTRLAELRAEGTADAAVDSAGVRRVIVGRATARRLVRLDNGLALLDESINAFSDSVGHSRSALSPWRNELRRRPVDLTTAMLLQQPLTVGDSAIIIDGTNAQGRQSWARQQDTLELRSRPADGWTSSTRVVVMSGLHVMFESVVPLMNPSIVRWHVRGDSIVRDDSTRRDAVARPKNPWAFYSEGTGEFIAASLPALEPSSQWQPFTAVTPRRDGIVVTPLEIRVRAFGAYRVIHLRLPGSCQIILTLLATADGTPLSTNVGGPFGETISSLPGTARYRRTELAMQVVTQRDLYPLVSIADQQHGNC